MPMRNIHPTGHQDGFIAEQIEAGNFQDADEVLRAGLRLLEQQTQSDQHRLHLLAKLATEGSESLDQRQGLVVDDEEMLQNTIAEIGYRASLQAIDARPVN